MKFSFVNGWMNPKFTVYDKFNRVVYKCTFAELNQDGMIESHEEITIQRTDLNYTLKEYFLGYRIHFTFYYNQFVNLETMNKFKALIDFQRSVNEGSPYKIFLTPNEENVSRRFEVLFSNESIDIGVIKSGQRIYGNKDVVFKLQTVELEKDFQITDPVEIHQHYLNNHYII